MNGMRPLLEGYIDLNIAALVALVVWFALRVVLQRTPLAHAYAVQRAMAGALLLAALATPVVSPVVTGLAALIWPAQSLAISDLAVAAYLNGRIDMPAVAFEGILNTRQNWVELALASNTLWVQGLWGLMLLGFGLMLGRLVLAAVRVRQTLNRSFLWRRTGRVDIRISDHATMPFACRGLRRHFVIIPSSLVMRPKDLRLVLAHEFLHIRKGDTELELLSEAIRPLFFWNPAFQIWKRQLDQLRELSCDQIVTQRPAWSPQDYAQCLIDLCAQSVRRAGNQSLQVGFIQSRRAKRDLKRRMAALLSGRAAAPRVAHGVTATLALCLFCLMALGAATLQPAKDWSQDRLMLGTVVNLERLEQINRQAF